jgi:RHS repeat-associated protein
VTKRFFAQGVKCETGTNAGSYYFTRDHLGSIRELTDASANVRARYVYDPFGRRTKVSGDMDADFGFAGMFWAAEANLALTHYRAYNPELGRWLSRDPIRRAELSQGPNLYAYVGNEPVNRVDPEGLCFNSVVCACASSPAATAACVSGGIIGGGEVGVMVEESVPALEAEGAALLENAEGVAQQCAQAVPKLVETGKDAIVQLSTQVSEVINPALAKTDVADTLAEAETEIDFGVEQPAWDWLRDMLNWKDSSLGYELLTSEHTREITLGIIERHRQMLDQLRATEQIQEWLEGLPGL